MAKFKAFAVLVVKFALITCVVAFADFLFLTGNHGVVNPQFTKTHQIEDVNLGKNRYLSLNEKFDLGSIAQWSNGVATQTFVSLFPAGDNKAAAPTLFIQFNQPLNIENRRALRKISAESPLKLKGLVRRGGVFETNLIRTKYPDLAAGPLILTWDTKAEPGAYWTANCLYLGCLFFGYMSLFGFCRSARLPVSQAARIGMILVGIVVAGISIPLWFAGSQIISPYLLSAAGLAGFSLVAAGARMTALGENMVWREKHNKANLKTVGNTLVIARWKEDLELPFADIVDITIPGDDGCKLEIRTADTNISIVSTEKVALQDNNKRQFENLSIWLAERAIGKILDGEEYTFGGWTIQGDEVRFGTTDKATTYRLDQLSALYVVDGIPKIWVFGNEHPVETLKTGVTNSSVFYHVIRYFVNLNQPGIELTQTDGLNADTQLSDTHESDLPDRQFDLLSEAPKQVNGLGNVIFEDKQFRLSFFGAVAISFVFAVITGLMSGIFVLFVIGAVVGSIQAYFHTRKNGSGSKLFRIHENGVSLEQGGETTRILYQDTESFRCNFSCFENQQVGAQLLQVAAIFASPLFIVIQDPDKWDFEFVSESLPGESPKRIKFDSTKKTDQFKRMQEEASREIGMRMAADLAENDVVQWTPGCFIYKDAIEVPVRWAAFNGGKPKRIALDQIVDAEINKTTLVLKIKSKFLAKKCKIEIKQPNFFPGFDLLQQLLEITRENSGFQEPESREPETLSSGLLSR